MIKTDNATSSWHMSYPALPSKVAQGRFQSSTTCCLIVLDRPVRLSSSVFVLKIERCVEVLLEVVRDHDMRERKKERPSTVRDAPPCMLMSFTSLHVTFASLEVAGSAATTRLQALSIDVHGPPVPALAPSR